MEDTFTKLDCMDEVLKLKILQNDGQVPGHAYISPSLKPENAIIQLISTTNSFKSVILATDTNFDN
jgi:hypothetical protein